MPKVNILIIFFIVIIVLFIAGAWYFYSADHHDQSINPSVQPVGGDVNKAIISFNFTGLNPEVYGTITQENHMVMLTVPYGTDITNLTPIIEVSPGATVSPESGKPLNFNHTVIYTVTAPNNTHQDYTVSVAVASLSVKAITNVTMPGQVGSTVINQKTHTITLTVSYGTDVTDLVPIIELIAGAVVSPASLAPQNFVSPVNYTVTTADHVKQTYTVMVNVASDMPPPSL